MGTGKPERIPICMKSPRFLLVLVVLALAAGACDLSFLSLERNPGAPDTPDPEAVQRFVDQTRTAEAQKRDEDRAEPTETPPATTQPPMPNTFTPSPTLSPTVTPTPTLFVEISGNTNCRVGPGDIYDLKHIYLVGDQAILRGRDEMGNYWYTQHPEQPSLTCWLWSRYAQPVGESDSLPVFTPPPTPTPAVDFEVTFAGPDCGAGSCWLWLRIKNTGGIVLESYRVYAKNMSNSDDATEKSNTFTDTVAGANISQILLGKKGYAHTGTLPNPTGKKVYITVKVCSKNDQKGTCLTKELTVKP